MFTILPWPRGDHPACDLPADQECAGQIGIQNLVPNLGREVHERTLAMDTSIVNQDIERAGLLLGSGDAEAHGYQGR